MATFFRTIQLFRYQQIRHLPRFSATPKLRTPLEKIPRIAPAEEIVSATTKKSPPKKPLLQRTECLVIKSGNDAKEHQPKKIDRRPAKVAPESQRPPLTNPKGGLVYTKLTKNDLTMSKLMADLKTKKTTMLLEGKRLIQEALMAKCSMRCIIFSRLQDLECLKPHLPERGILYKAAYKDLQLWSELTTTPGVMAIFDIPSDTSTPLELDQEPLPLTVVCDNVREPNNLGAILRTSSGAGCQKLLLTKGCVNLWDSKVLRTACGAHFKLELAKDLEWERIRSMIPENANILIADNKTVTGDPSGDIHELIGNIPLLPYYSPNFRLMQHLVLIIGGETEGVSEHAYRLAKEFNGARLHVPLNNKVDSLNTGTALGIIAFEIKRQLMISESQQ